MFSAFQVVKLPEQLYLVTEKVLVLVMSHAQQNGIGLYAPPKYQLMNLGFKNTLFYLTTRGI